MAVTCRVQIQLSDVHKWFSVDSVLLSTGLRHDNVMNEEGACNSSSMPDISSTHPGAQQEISQVMIPSYCHTNNLAITVLTTREAAWYMILVVSVCLSVCMSVRIHVCLSDDNCRKPWRIGSSYLHAHAVSSYMKSSGQGQGHKSQKGRKFLFPQRKTSIGNNSRSITHRAVMFACSMGFLDRME